GDDRPHQQPVAQHRGQGGQPLVGAPGGEEGGDEGGGGAHHHIQRPVGAEDVDDQAPDEEPPAGDRGQEGQDGQGLGEAALDGAEGQAEDVAEVAHDHVQGPHQGGGGELADGDVFHILLPPFFV